MSFSLSQISDTVDQYQFCISCVTAGLLIGQALNQYGIKKISAVVFAVLATNATYRHYVNSEETEPVCLITETTNDEPTSGIHTFFENSPWGLRESLTKCQENLIETTLSFRALNQQCNQTQMECEEQISALSFSSFRHQVIAGISFVGFLILATSSIYSQYLSGNRG